MQYVVFLQNNKTTVTAAPGALRIGLPVLGNMPVRHLLKYVPRHVLVYVPKYVPGKHMLGLKKN